MEVKNAKCHPEKNIFCDALDRALLPEANAHQKGLVMVSVTNMMTGVRRTLGIAYKTSSKDKGVMLNFCPWCGLQIDRGFRKMKDEQTETKKHSDSRRAV